MKGGYLIAQKDGEELDLRGGILRADADRDVLIIRIDVDNTPALWKRIPDLEVVRFDDLERGEKVYAIGNPAGLENTITDGLLSGLRTAQDTVQRLVQISAPISPGSSGGGVFDGRGRLIGMSTFILRPNTGQNLNFALPVDEILYWDRSKTRHDIKEAHLHPEYEAGLKAWKAHDCVEAIPHFDLVPDDEPTKGRAFYYSARCLQQSKKYTQAKVDYERALRSDPRIARAHAFLATLLLAEGDTIGAMSHQLKAYELDPSLRDVNVTMDDW